MRLWLHVGAHKTGTTSLQNNLWRARDVLLQFGIVYPDNVTGVAFRKRQRFTHAFMVDALRRSVLEQHVDGIIQHYGKSDYFFSSEGFGEVIFRRRKELGKVLEPRFDDIKVLLYLRDPASQVVSRAGQKLLHGKTMDDILADPPFFDYRREVEEWWSIFGRSNVVVRPYGVQETTADVLEVLGLPPEAVPERNWRNRTPSVEGIEAIRQARENGENWDGKGRLPGRRFALPQEIVDKAVAVAANDLRWLEKELGVTLPTEHCVEPAAPSPAAMAT
jgi:hypothetical protein